MDTLFPSEIARLVLGYLKEDKCLKSWQTFLEESSNLREYFTLFKKGRVYPTNVNGYSLLDILNEYSTLKFQAMNKEPKTESECFSSKSEITENLKEENIVESTEKTVDCVFIKYLSPSDNLKDNVSTDLSPDNSELPKPNNSSIEEVKTHCTDVAEDMAVAKSDHSCDRQNVISAKNDLNSRNEQDKTQGYQRNRKLNTELNKEKTDPLNNERFIISKKSKDVSDRNISPDSLTSFIQSLSDKLNKKENSTFKLPNFVQQKCDLKDNNPSLSKLKPSNNAVSSTGTVLIDEDDDIEIVKEIKKEGKSFDNLSSKAKTDCSNNTSANLKAGDNIVPENTLINEPRHKSNSFNDSNIEDLQTNNLKDFKIQQTDANNQNKINEQESKTDSSNNQVCYVDSGPFIQSSTAVNEMSFSYPQNYILPSYTPSNSFTNNAPVYVVLNTSGAPCGSVINGTILTVPTVQSNTVPCSVSPAVSTAFVNNSITAPLNSFVSSLPTTNIASNVDEVLLSSLKAPQNDILTTASVGLSTTLKEKNISKSMDKVNKTTVKEKNISKTMDKVSKTTVKEKNIPKTKDKVNKTTVKEKNIPKTTCNKTLRKSPKTYSKESQSSKVSKRKSSPKGGQKKKLKDSLLPKDQLIPAREAGISSLFKFKEGQSKTSKIFERKNSPQKMIPKTVERDSLLPKDRLIPTPEAALSLIDHKDGHSNQGKSKISTDSCPSKVQKKFSSSKVTKSERNEKQKDKKRKKSKTSAKSPPPLKVKIEKPKISWLQSVWEEKDAPLHDKIEHHLNPSNINVKTGEVNYCTKSNSTFSTSLGSFNNSSQIKSSLPNEAENRTLKVLLSDIFVNIHHKIDSLHDQGSDSSTNPSLQGRSECRIGDSEKMSVQNQKSPYSTISDVNSKYLMTSQTVDSCNQDWKDFTESVNLHL